jgi:hypothetical protein
MIPRVVQPASIQAVVETQPTLPFDNAEPASDARPYPYSEHWRRANVRLNRYAGARDGREDDVFALIEPKKADAPPKTRKSRKA